eukprot:scaffold395_cov383-Prasinococcus_capsulatus_cf.AAC.19
MDLLPANAGSLGQRPGHRGDLPEVQAVCYRGQHTGNGAEEHFLDVGTIASGQIARAPRKGGHLMRPEPRTLQAKGSLLCQLQRDFWVQDAAVQSGVMSTPRRQNVGVCRFQHTLAAYRCDP